MTVGSSAISYGDLDSKVTRRDSTLRVTEQEEMACRSYAKTPSIVGLVKPSMTGSCPTDSPNDVGTEPERSRSKQRVKRRRSDHSGQTIQGGNKQAPIISRLAG